ncbi:sigma 54-interacting transcriptional regulator [bacterium]|nr:sigma 54-interacting transcriptional regulator [bacterium]
MLELTRYQQSLINRCYVGVIGKPQFCRSVNQALKRMSSPPEHFVSQLADGWQKTLERHPNFLLVELDDSNDRDYQLLLREFLEQVHTRFKGETVVAVVLTGISQLLSAGNLLFQDENSYESSALVHFFLTAYQDNPVARMQPEMIREAVELVGRTFERRDLGLCPLPALNEQGWTNSMGDLQSLRLWMKWLPRYARYTQESPIIIGRTGTGKTNLARALHTLSGRKGAFVAMTPRDFSSSELIQAELFGAVAGAYTGAVDKWGLVRSAEGGTLFFDEFQSIDLELQGKLITFIENKTYRRVGSAERTEADVRFVFASNRPLFELVEEGLVREDFAYRLERVMLELPPLNERPFDIAPALAYGLAKLHRQRSLQRPITGFTKEAYHLLFSSTWPGNLRQLENVIAKACERVELENKQMIGAEQIRDLVVAIEDNSEHRSTPLLQGIFETVRTFEQEGDSSFCDVTEKLSQHIRSAALQRARGNPVAASEMISDDISIMRLYRAFCEAEKR